MRLMMSSVHEAQLCMRPTAHALPPYLSIGLWRCMKQGGECGVPFWKRMLMPVSDHPWVDAEAQRRPPEWYSYNYGSVRPHLRLHLRL